MSVSSDPRELLAESFAALDRRLHRNLLAYVLVGRHPKFPARLTAAQRAAITAIPFEARREFYLHLDAIDRADDAVIVRLGRLLLAALPPWVTAPARVPQSVWAVLNDARRAAFGQSWSSAEFTTLSIERLGALLRLEGVRPDAVPGMLIDILVATSGRSPEYRARGLQTIPGIAEFVAAHPAELRARVASFSASAALEVVRLASLHPPLALQHADLLAAYAIGSHRDARAAAVALVPSLPVQTQIDVLEPLLATTPASLLPRLIGVIERIPDRSAAVGVLERALARGGKGAAEIERAIQRLAIYEQSGAPETVVVPPMVPWDEHPLDEAAVESIRTALAAHRDRETRFVATMTSAAEPLKYFPGSYSGSVVEAHERGVHLVDQALDSLPGLVDYLSGRSGHPGSELLEVLALPGVAERFVGFEPINWARLSARPDRVSILRPAVMRQERVTDARALAEALERSGYTEAEAHSVIVGSYFTRSWVAPTLAAHQLVEYLAERPHTFDVILGLENGVAPQAHSDLRADVLAILELSPALAARYIPVVTDLAIGSTRPHRADAQRVLERHGLAEGIAAESLRASTTSVRTAAVLWIESLGGPWATETLVRHLEREAAAPVRATILAALERSGSDIRAHLRPEVLGAEAVAGLAKGTPAGLAWFPFAELPPARYANGEVVPAHVLRWWVVLGHTLRDPAGAGLLPIYVRMLDADSAADLGRSVLTAWLTTGGLADKGILALSGRTPGPELAQTVRQFMRQHHLLRSQIGALLTLLSLSDEPEPLQLLAATGRRYRTATLQELARELVGAVASRRGWTPDELADRMIPRASLDDDRMLRLDYGPRSFVARLAPTLRLSLETEFGEPVKALPAPREADSSAAEAKAEFAAAKKELAAVVASQGRRLYDAMCLRREWSGAQWRELVLEHPVMGVLAAGLVWHVDGAVGRPDLDGSVRRAGGSVLELTATARVSIAHSTTLSTDDIASWHALPSAVTLGFDQFAAARVVVVGTESRRTDLVGAPSESLVLRSRARAREWDHGALGDGQSFDEYVKSFESAGVEGVVAFSGSALPEENLPIELGALSVRRTTRQGRGEEVRFAQMPPALLAELVADYLAFGAGTPPTQD